MSKSGAREIAHLIKIVEMVRDREQAHLARHLAAAGRIRQVRLALEAKMEVARNDARFVEDPAVHISALNWQAWAKEQASALAAEEAKARALAEDRKAALAQAMGRVSALAEIARKTRIEDQRKAQRRAQTS